ncbi:MAG: methyltransferase domain-containing protein [Planctomycetales bacterium]|nr:methyltransferase domain-containing protein [Planctomycetales bacterium]
MVESDAWDDRVETQVRSQVGRELAAFVIATAALQKKARLKLGHGIWWCTERSLSQATPHQVAALKARWIGSANVYDLCCGIGADTLAFAKAATRSDQSVTAIDRDPVMVAMATENVRLGLQDPGTAVRVECEDVAKSLVSKDSLVYLDPDRRDDSGRKVRPQDYSPPWDVVQQIVARCDAAIVKLAPAAEIEDQPDQHRVWISLGGSVREQSLLTGTAIDNASGDLKVDLAKVERSAVVIGSDGTATTFACQCFADSVRQAETPEQFLIDPDAAIRAAGLTASFAEQFQLSCIGGPAGFLTGAHQVDQALAVCESVIWSGACDDRKLRKTLRTLDCYPWRVKTRGVAQDPNVLEKRYRNCGQRPVTLWIGKATRRQFAALTVSS